MRLLTRLAAICVAVLATVPATAATTIVTGNTSGGPTFNRPLSGGVALSGVGTNVSYQAIGFTVSASGNYTFDLSSTFDNFLAVYSAPFNPANPLSNLLGADDDTVGSNARLVQLLLAGTSYVAVATAFDNGDGGAFTLTANGPGTLSVGVAAVPEPATWAMMLLGFGAIGASLRRRRTPSVKPRFGAA